MARRTRYPNPSKYAKKPRSQMRSYIGSGREGFIERMTERWYRKSFGDDSRQSYSWQRRMTENKVEGTFGKIKDLHIRYKNLLLIILGVAAGIWIAYNPGVLSFFAKDPSLGYIGAFVMGLMYPVGITTPAAIVGFFELGKVMDPLVLSGIGAVGALISNFIVFYFIRHSMLEHLDKITKRFNVRIHVVGHVIRKHPLFKHLIPMIAGVIIATPIPTEIAIGIFAAIKFETKKFLLYAFVFSIASIYIVSRFGSAF